MTEQKQNRLLHIDMIEVFNEVIGYLADEVAAGKELPRNIQVLDMKFEVIRTHLTHVAQRALELEDPLLQARLVAVGLLTATRVVTDPEPKGNA